MTLDQFIVAAQAARDRHGGQTSVIVEHRKWINDMMTRRVAEWDASGTRVEPASPFEGPGEALFVVEVEG